MKKLVFGRISMRLASGDLEALVHRTQESDQADRVEVEDRFGDAAKAGARIVAGDRQDVEKTFGRVAPGGGFQAVAIHVLAGQVDDNPRFLGDHAGQPIGRKHRRAARAIGDRDPADPRVG